MKYTIFEMIVLIVFQFVSFVMAFPVSNVKDNDRLINMLSRMISVQPCQVRITAENMTSNSPSLKMVNNLKELSIPVTIGQEILDHDNSNMNSCHLDILIVTTNKYIKGLDLKKEENIYVYNN